MIVTAIEQQKHKPERYSVFIDGNFSFGMIMQDILYFKLSENCEISQEKYNFIIDTLIYVKAQEKAINYLGYKMRTQNEVEKKLSEYDYSEEVISKVIEFLLKYKYIDDSKYCDSFIRESIKLRPKGKYLIKMELRQKGIASHTIDEALEASDLDEYEGAKKLLLKKIRDFTEVSEKEKQRAFGLLQRRGFSYEISKEVYNSIIEDENE